MTGYTVHTGSTVKFSGGWDHIFSGKTSAKAPAKKKSAKAAKPAKKAAAKKRGKAK
jgi:hypothetical protein